MRREGAEPRGGQTRNGRAGGLERRVGPVDRRAGARPDEPVPGRRFTDYLRTTPHLLCTACGEPWITEILRERLNYGGDCPRCGGRPEQMGDPLGNEGQAR
jgi:hypothetical protein